MDNPNQNFSPNALIRQAIEDLFSLEGKNALEYTYLLPSQRSCIALENTLRDVLNGQNFIVPKIYSFMGWMSEVSGTNLVSSWNLQLLFWKLYQDRFSAKNFSEYLTKSRIFLSDFNEIDYSVANAKQLFDSLQDIENLEAVFSGGKMRTEEREQNKNMRVSYELLKQFLNENGLGYAGGIARKLLQNIDTTDLDQHYAVIGLNAFNTAEESILKYLQKNKQLRFYWDTDHHYMDSDLRGAGYFLRKNRRFFGLENEFKYIGNGLSQHKKIREICCATDLEQAYYLRSALKKRLEKKQSLSSCAIILLDETLLPLVLEQIPKSALPCNITMGKPLASEPLFLFFIDTGTLFFNAGTIEKYDFESWLQNNFAQYLFEDKNQFKNILNHIQTSKKSNFDRVELHELCKHSQIKECLIDEDKLLSSSFSILLRMLNRLQPYLSLDSDKAASDHLSLMLEELSGQEKKYHFLLQLEDVKQVLLESSKGLKISFIGNHNDGLQIMGLLETRALDFQTLFIVSLSEGILPANASSPTYLPQDIRKKFGLNLPAFQERVVSYHFFRLLQKAEEAHLIYAQSSQDISLKEPSRFLSQIEYELGTHYDYKKITVKNQVSLNTNDHTFLGWHHTEATLDRVRALLKKGISVSGITLLFTDPLSFLKQKILGVSTDETRAKEADMRVLGSLLHSVLEILYRQWIGRPLPILSLEERKSLVNNAFTAALAKDDYGYDWKEGLQTFTLEDILKPTVVDFFSSDTQSAKEKKIDITACEQKLITSIPATEAFPEIQLVGVMDQIRSEDGITRIIDFKLSDSNFSMGIDMNKSPEELQDFFAKNTYNLQFVLYAYLYLKNHPEKSRVQVAGVFFKKRGVSKFLSLKHRQPQEKNNCVYRSDLTWIEESILHPIFLKLEKGFREVS